MKKTLVTLILLILIEPLLLASDVTQTPNLIDLTSRDYESIGITEYLSLDSYEPKRSIGGVRLQCHDDSVVNSRYRPIRRRRKHTFSPSTSFGRIMFCEDSCDESSTPESLGPTISIECANYIDQAIRQCVEAMGCTRNIRFCGVGGHAKRLKNVPGKKSGSPSRHSSGDALDLFGVQCTKSDGSSLKLELSNQGRLQTPEAYDSFVECWRKSMKSSRPRANGHKGAIACTSAEPPRNELHNDHVHLSCPTPRQKTGGT